jgi:8-amino-7-oxononanoate synthase
MNGFELELTERLNAISRQGLRRELRHIDSPQSTCIKINGKSLINFSSNDYLGLANDPLLRTAATKAVEKFGAGSGSSRLICGSLFVHQELEEAIANFKGTQSALSFSTGYAAAIGAICALMAKQDIIILDKLVHACIVDAARLCGAKLRIFAHNDLENLEEILKWASTKSPLPRILIVTESIFSMDGDQASLREIVALKEKYGAWLMVDEAHATGLYGVNGRGLAGENGVAGNIEVQMGTLGKALGSSGGFICGSRVLIDYLINRARSFIFSTAPVPAAAAGATAAIGFVQSSAGEERRTLLWQRVAELTSALKSLRSGAAYASSRFPSAIFPILIGDETKAAAAAAALLEHGVFVPAIRYPSVARGQARLRLAVNATHTSRDVQQAVAALVNVLPVSDSKSKI